jgi:tetratricopeptide (TPR) repeat protein
LKSTLKRLIFSFILIFCFSLIYSHSYAETQIEECPEIKIIINGNQKHTGNLPIKIDEKILLPIKEILNELGIQVDDKNIIYSQTENSLKMITDSLTIYLKSGSKEALINEKPVILDDIQTIYNKDGLIYSQFEVIAKSFGRRYLVDEKNNIIYIIDEKQYLQTKEILDKAFGVLESAKNYKYSKKYSISSESNGNKNVFDYNSEYLINRISKIAYEKEQYSNLNNGNTSSLKKESYFSKDSMYYKNSTERNWSWELFNENSIDPMFEENIFDTTFNAFHFFYPNEFFYAGLILRESDNPNEIILRGDINIKKEFNDLFEFPDATTECFSEMRINKDTYQFNQINNNFIMIFKIGENDQKLDVKLGYYNINYPQNLEIGVPNNLINITEDMRIKAVLNQGIDYLKVGSNEDAIKCFDAVIKIQPKNSDAYLNKGRALLNLNKITDAIELYNKAVGLNKNLISEYSNIGKKYFELKKYNDSIKYLNMALKNSPNNGEACYYKAEILFNKGSYKDALVFYYRAAIQKYCSYNTINDKGYELRINSKYELAILYYDKLIELDKNNGIGYSEKAFCLEQLNRYQEALKYYNKAIVLRKDDIANYHNKADILNILNKPLEAKKCLEAALKIKPVGSYGYNNMGNVLEDLGRHDEAIKYFDRAIELDPNDPNAYNNKGIALLAQEKYSEAVECYDKAIEVNSNYAFAYYNKGIALTAQKKYIEAIKCYDKAIVINPNYINAYNEKYVILIALGKNKEAEQLIKIFEKIKRD